MPLSDEFPYRSVLAALPLAAREAWGRRANELTPDGTPLDSPMWFAMERRAYEEILVRLAADEFSETEPIPAGPSPTSSGPSEFDFGEARS
jgi:hypothetical protein